MASSSEKKIILKSSDGKIFEVEKAVAVVSQTIKHLIENKGADDSGIPIPNVTGTILGKIIEYGKKHVEAANAGELKKWDAEFIKVNQAILFDIMMAADYLNIKSLLDLTFQAVADIITGKTVEEICTTFDIPNDFTPEEEEEARRES